MEVPEYFVGGFHGVAGGDQFSPEKQRHGGGDQKPGEPFAIDDLLDFSNADAMIMSDGFFDNAAGVGNSADSSTVTAVDSCNSSVSGGVGSRGFGDHHQFSSGELCVPVIHDSHAHRQLQQI